MKQLVENAINAAEAAREAIGKIRDKLQFGDPNYDMADDAYLGARWAAKRLKDLESNLAQP